MQARTWTDYLLIAVKGMLMGAADAVPGVSGGTIAFMTGIYEELIHSLKQCEPKALKVLFSQGIGAAWRYINGWFLLALFGGVIISIATVARLVLHWLDNYPALLWAFFFGLIIAAIWSLIRNIAKWNLGLALAFLLGALSAYLITSIPPTQVEPASWFFFVSGMIAICAMILPGISGSFLLLLLGMYSPILLAVKEFQFSVLAIFAAGCVLGLLSFSHVLDWMFKHYRNLTLALLGGFMLGSLNKVWPWKYTLEYAVNRHGEQIPLVQQNVLPTQFESLTGQPSLLGYAVGLMLLGLILVLLLERIGKVKPK